MVRWATRWVDVSSIPWESAAQLRDTVIARYLVGILHSRTPSFFDLHRPVSFSTTATPVSANLLFCILDSTDGDSISAYFDMVCSPLLGLDFLTRTGTWINHYFHKMGHYLFSRSGQHVYLLDDDHDGRPLLDIMADPSACFSPSLTPPWLIESDMVWLKALQLFPKILIIANGYIIPLCFPV